MKRFKQLFSLLLSLIIAFSLASCNKKDTKVTKPGFTKNDLIYFVMTDRFYDGDKSNNQDVNKSSDRGYHGGDLKGITQKLDYIKSLGATGIWITPVILNDYGGYHGYWGIDWYKLDPHFGTMDDMKNLVKEAHKRNIKVLMDYVVNHTGTNTPWLTDGKHKNWFHDDVGIDYSNQTSVENGWLSGLPDLNQNNTDVKKYFIDNTLWWIKETDIDGMRLDTVKHVSKDFWQEFTKTVKDKYPNFFFLGEVFSGDSNYLEDYHKAGIDGLVNYPIYYGIKDAFAVNGNMGSLVNNINSESVFTNPGVNGTFIDNHDNPRFLNNFGQEGPEYLKQALTFIMTYPTMPVIYYGTEIAMDGAGDPDNRRDMDWDKVNSSDTLKFYKQLVSLRQNNDAIKNGKFNILSNDSNYIAYTMSSDKSTVLVVINNATKEMKVSLDLSKLKQNYKELISGDSYSASNGKLDLTLKPSSTLILESK